MADAKQAVSDLADKLKSDPSARAKFMEDMKGLLQKHGVDVNDSKLMHDLGVSEHVVTRDSSTDPSTYIMTWTH